MPSPLSGDHRRPQRTEGIDCAYFNLGAVLVRLIPKLQLTFLLGPRQILKPLAEGRLIDHAEEKRLIAAAVVEIFVRQHKGLGIFNFTRLPMKNDHLCLPSAHRRGRLNRYVVTDVTQNADSQRTSETPAEPSYPCVYVSFSDEI